VFPRQHAPDEEGPGLERPPAGLLTLLGLVALEAWLRHTIPTMREGKLYAYTDQSLRYKITLPHARIRSYGTEIRTNALGFRGPQVAPKQPGEYRVVVLGDSMTFGPGMADGRLYTAQLEQRVPGARIINLAVEGYNVLHYQAVLEEVGLALQPDLIVVALFPVNDFEMDNYDNHVRIASGAALAGEPWYYSLYVYRAYLQRVEHAARRVMHRLAPAAAASERDVGWERNIGALKNIVELAGKQRIPVLVSLLPHTKGFETQRAMFARVERWCSAEGVRCLDLLAIFRARRVIDGELVLNRIDAHGNAEYHRLVAELLAPHLLGRMRQPQP